MVKEGRKSGGIEKETGGSMMKKAPLFSIIGAFVGLPVSYLFQPGYIRGKVSIGEYLANLGEIMSSDMGNFSSPVIIAVILCAVAGGLVGYMIDQNSANIPGHSADSKANELGGSQLSKPGEELVPLGSGIESPEFKKWKDQLVNDRPAFAEWDDQKLFDTYYSTRAIEFD